MKKFSSSESYLSYLENQNNLPEGFQIGVTSLEFTPVERRNGPGAAMNMTALILDEPTESFAAVFTRNAFPGYPVRIGRELLNEKTVQGVLVNNKIANVCAPGGYEAALNVTNALAKQMPERIKAPLFPSSTGVIGWSLPVDAMIKSLPALAGSLQAHSALPAAQGIMTTDTFPKLRSLKLGSGTICGMAKGAGMIEPNMATMLVFLMTDIQVERPVLRKILNRVADRTFNRISVDSDQSTSDSVFLFSSERKPSVPEEQFEQALFSLCSALAEDVVRNGEGTAHVIKVTVHAAESDEQAVAFGKALINSPLTKTAIYGNDPNVGRFVQAVGDYAGNAGISLDESAVRISLGGENVFSDGEFHLDSEKEVRLSEYLKSLSLPSPCPGYPEHDGVVEIDVTLGLGKARASVTGSDLSYEYVKENADYRT